MRVTRARSSIVGVRSEPVSSSTIEGQMPATVQ